MKLLDRIALRTPLKHLTLRSGHRLLQRPSPQQPIPGNHCLLAVAFVVGMVAMAVSPAQATVIPVNAPTPQTVLTMNIVTDGYATYNVNGTAYNDVTIESQAAGTFGIHGANYLRPGRDNWARFVQPTSSDNTFGIYYHFKAVPGQAFTSFTFNPAMAVNVARYDDSYAGVYVHWDVSTDGTSYTELARGDNSNADYYTNHTFGTLNAFPAVGTNPTDIYIKTVCYNNGNSSAANLFGWDVIPSPYQLDNLLTVTAQTQAMAAATTTTTAVVSSSLNNTSTIGEGVTFTATIVPDPDSGAFPAGNVQFMLDGTTDLGLVAVTQVGSTSHGTAATTSITTIPVGSAHGVTAEYIPATGFLTSTGTLSPNQTVLSKYDGWALAKGLDSGNKGATLDPDADAVPNFIEFAFNGDPKSAADIGMVYSTTETTEIPGGKVLVLTVAVRKGGTTWADNFATIDGITYTIEGGMTLGDFDPSTTRVALLSGQTGPTELTGTDYEWRRFYLVSSVGLGTKGFLRAKVVEN